MNIRIAKHAGFCSGVDRAYKIAVEAAASGAPTYILGRLVHNSKVIAELESKGVKSIGDVSEINKGEDCAIVISAHGVGPQVYKDLEGRCSKIIDTTCPFVKKAQRKAHELAEQGYQVVIIGDKKHTEVKGIMGWAGTGAVVVEKPEDVDTLELRARAGIVAQTTQSLDNFNAVVDRLKGRVKELKVNNTLCSATSRMQSSAVELAVASDIMLVIGDRMSANTKRLRELCESTGTETHQMQDVSELKTEWFEGKENVGVTAGASTPAAVIEEVVRAIQQ